MNRQITTIDQLRRLLASPKVPDDSVMLDLPFLDAATNRRYSESIDADRHECGCGTGGRFLVLSAVTCAMLCIFRISVFATGRWRQLAIAAAIVFVSAMAGKAVGLLRARLRLRWTVRAIEKASRQRGSVFGVQPTAVG